MVTKKITPKSISVTVIRKNTENAEVLLKTLLYTVGEKKVSRIGTLGAKISFDEKDTHTMNKLVSVFSGLNIDEEDKMSLTIRDKGIPIVSLCCNKTELEKFLLA